MILPEGKLDLILEILRQHDKRFEQIELNQRSDKQELLMAIQREGRDREKMEDKLEKVYESRDKVKIMFGWQWGAIYMIIAIISAFLGGGLAGAFVR